MEALLGIAATISHLLILPPLGALLLSRVPALRRLVLN